MPLYEYACTECGERVEKMRKFDARLDAPECGACGSATALALSAPARVSGSEGTGSSIPARADAGGCGPGGCGVGFT